MKVDKTKWKQNIISDCIKTVKVKGAVQKKDYQQYGKYPIISQEKDFISGYCDSIENLNSIGEVVIFGDHTRVLKFVDFDFCVGADGVKVIRPSSDISTKYLFYFLKWADIPSNGYSRHFKFLKELSISYPSLPNQQVIASELDVIQKMIDGYKAQLEDLDALAQSIFLDMFGDPVANPKGWENKSLNAVGLFARGVSKHRPRNAPELLGGTMPLIQTGDIANAGMYVLNYATTYSEFGVSQSKVWPAGTLCITIAANIGKCSILRFDACFPDSVVGYISNKEYTRIEYIFFIFKSLQKVLEANAQGIAQKNINLQVLNSLVIPVPPLPLQQQFATRVEQIEKQKEQIRLQLADAETLMAERMQYYFS